MQSTGQTSTHSVSFVLMHGSVMTKVISLSLHKNGHERKAQAMDEAEKRANVVRLAFGGSEERFAEFQRVVREEIPEGTRVVLRGSAVTGCRWKDGAPFDADGPGTSDLDLTLVGSDALLFFNITGFFVPGVHSRPMGEDDPDIAPALVPLRETLMAIVHRPVNIQASREIVLKL